MPVKSRCGLKTDQTKVDVNVMTLTRGRGVV